MGKESKADKYLRERDNLKTQLREAQEVISSLKEENQRLSISTDILVRRLMDISDSLIGIMGDVRADTIDFNDKLKQKS